MEYSGSFKLDTEEFLFKLKYFVDVCYFPKKKNEIKHCTFDFIRSVMIFNMYILR